MKLNEIFDHEPEDLRWVSAGNRHTATFTLSSDVFSLVIDEYDLELPRGKVSVADVTFAKNGKTEKSTTTEKFHALGGINTALINKIKQLRPAVVSYGALSDIPRRKKVYTHWALMFSRGSSYTYQSPWFKYANGEHMFISKFEPSVEDMTVIKEFFASIPEKENPGTI